MKKLMALILTFNSAAFGQTKPAKVDRPPQFVLLAFDGSYNIDIWNETRQWAIDTRKKLKADVKFTYFISGVHWLHKKNYANYMPPHKKSALIAGKEKEEFIKTVVEKEKEDRTKEAIENNLSEKALKNRRSQFSEISFGDNKEDVEERIRQVSLAFNEGHEIASHGNGHFAGGLNRQGWSIDQWMDEFEQFINLIFNAFNLNEIQKDPKYPQTGYSFTKENIIGYRAPQLSVNDDMFIALSKMGYRYDTSGPDGKAVNSRLWPYKNRQGTWLFPLGSVNIFGTDKWAPSMDFNFFYMQSKGIEDAENKNRYRDQMFKSYMKYFNDNYYGNRAPVHIGHHFSQFNGGAYWEAMKKFGETVCGNPEVKCVTYTEYMNWLEEQDKQKLALYSTDYTKDVEDGNNITKNLPFLSLPKPPDLKSEIVVGKTEPKLTVEGNLITATVKMDRLSHALGYKLVLKINNQIEDGTSVHLDFLRNKFSPDSYLVVSAAVINKQGDETNSFSLRIKNIATPAESISDTPIEEEALLVDPPAAHVDEQ